MKTNYGRPKMRFRLLSIIIIINIIITIPSSVSAVRIDQQKLLQSFKDSLSKNNPNSINLAQKQSTKIEPNGWEPASDDLENNFSNLL